MPRSDNTPIEFQTHAAPKTLLRQAAKVPDALNELNRIDVRRVAATIGLSESWIWEAVRRGQFPQPTRIGKRCTRWTVGPVREWLEGQ